MAMRACVASGRICVVGDDRQAIYSFRGAASGGLDMMKSKLNAVEMGLTTTYRCPKKVVALAQVMVPDYKVADSAPEGIVDDANEAALIESVQVGDAVLSRTNAPLMPLCLQLLRKGVAARIEGRDLGKALVGLVRKMKGRSVPDFIGKVERWGDKMKSRARKSKNAEEKISGIEDQVLTLVAVAEGAASVFEIEKRILDIFQDSDKCPKPAVVFSSVHKAKGLEWDRVFILEWTFHKKMGRQMQAVQSLEEQNIRYVAITRAKNHLVRVHQTNRVQAAQQGTATGTNKTERLSHFPNPDQEKYL
jgi:superfamily I DNA/RNA helicase